MYLEKIEISMNAVFGNTSIGNLYRQIELKRKYIFKHKRLV